MLGRPLPYILNIKNIENDDLELVGHEAMDNSKIFEMGLLTPPCFILTTRAFDDFLTASNLIDPILVELGEVKPYSKISAKKASEAISELILRAKYPSILERPLIEAYKNLGTHNIPYVSIEASNIIDPKFIPEYNNHKEINIRGEEDVLKKIKEVWASLFSTEAIELRANENYSGVLSVAVMIQKMIRAEVSGKVYTIPPLTDEKNTTEIHAIYGFDDQVSTNSLGADVYKIDKQTQKIIEKNIIQQEYMIVQKGNVSQGENANIEIEISKQWKGVQKLEDRKIIELAEIASHIEKYFDEPVVADWGLELGEFFITKISKERVQKEHKERDFLDLQSYKSEIEIIPLESHIQKHEVEQKKEDVDFNKLTKEINNLVKNRGEIVLNDEAEKLEPEIALEEHKTKQSKPELKIEKLSLLTPLMLDISKMNSEVLDGAKKFNGGFFDGTEIILNNGVLPEYSLGSQKELSDITGRFTMEISTASKSVGDYPMIYQFSSIYPYELKLIGVDESKLSSFGDQRLIENPEALSIEVLAVKKIRNQFGYRNLNICIPSLRNYANLINIKKIVTAEGLRRAATLKMYAEVSIPSFVFEVSKIDENDLDGLIINYDKLLLNSLHRNHISDDDHDVILSQIRLIKDICKDKRIEVLVRLTQNAYKSEILEKLIQMNTSGLIFNSIPSQEVIDNIERIEKENLQHLNFQKKGPGRKIKELF